MEQDHLHPQHCVLDADCLFRKANSIDAVEYRKQSASESFKTECRAEGECEGSQLCRVCNTSSGCVHSERFAKLEKFLSSFSAPGPWRYDTYLKRVENHVLIAFSCVVSHLGCREIDNVY